MVFFFTVLSPHPAGGVLKSIKVLMVLQKVENAFLLSFRRKPWFDELTTLSIAEGESSVLRRLQIPGPRFSTG
jgi:hypothetical protein